MPGTLYVVATPIGNLEDLTFRALRILGEVDLVAAEDTRRTLKLLTHFKLRKPMVSLREHNETRESPRLVGRLQAGASIALVSDAGTPGIADPGAGLVRAARAAGIPVVPIPGPSAVVAALSIAGASEATFSFLGFPPPKGSERTNWLEQLRAESRTAVFFEAPHRIERTMAEVSQLLVNRHILCFRELTKIHEELVITPIITDDTRGIGEFTIVVLADPASDRRLDELDLGLAVDLFGRLTDKANIEPDIAASMLSAYLRVDAKVVLKAVKKARILVKQHNQ